MREFKGGVAVVTGAGSGIGRALAVRLAAAGSHLALCDISEQTLEETAALCQEADPTLSICRQVCDVANEAEVLAFAEWVRAAQEAEHVDLLINNAGISGGGSFIESPRDEWERTFSICWDGVYLMTRAFLPLLMNSRQGHLVNMASANALRAVLGGHVPHTAYSAAKFAVRGFSEALIHDFRFNAPHLSVSVVMPGHTGTGIMAHSAEVLGHNAPAAWTDAEVQTTRKRWTIAGRSDHEAMSDDEIRAAGAREIADMQRLGMAPAEAAQIILDGVRAGRWRILVGSDTESLDALVRESPDRAYDPDFVDRWRAAHEALRSSR